MKSRKLKEYLAEINRLRELLEKEKKDKELWKDAYERKEFTVAKLSIELCVAQSKLNKLENKMKMMEE